MWLFKVAKTSKYASTTTKSSQLGFHPKLSWTIKLAISLCKIRSTYAPKGRWRGAHINLANLQLEMSTAVATRSWKFSQDFIVDFQVQHQIWFSSLTFVIFCAAKVCKIFGSDCKHYIKLHLCNIFLMMTLLIMKYNHQIAAAVISVFQI